MTRKRLIVNADDFGLSRGITDGILRAHHEGIVTSTSLMVNQPASEYAMTQARSAPNLGVGVHLNICEGKPILSPESVPSLVASDGNFLPPDMLIQRLWRCQLSTREIEAEFRAQIRWMKDRGVVPTHADSHRHMHHYPGAIFSFYRAVLKEEIRCARGFRLRASPRNGVVGGPYAGSLLRRLAVTAYANFFQDIVMRKLFFPDSGITPHPLYRGKLDQLTEGWSAVLDNLPAGSYEAGCHPGLSEPEFSETDEYRERREAELKVFTNPRFRSLIARKQIELISYLQL